MRIDLGFLIMLVAALVTIYAAFVGSGWLFDLGIGCYLLGFALQGRVQFGKVAA